MHGNETQAGISNLQEAWKQLAFCISSYSFKMHSVSSFGGDWVKKETYNVVEWAKEGRGEF